MGFPKPWPTEWPDTDHRIYRDEPDVVTPDSEPDRGREEPRESPEVRRRFSAVTWAVTHPCNLKCTHCYDAVPQKRRDLSTAEALCVIANLHAAGVNFIAFSGGEAFLRKDLFRLMRCCAERRIQFGARSNGTLISPDIARRIKELGISVVGVSFDGATRNTHDAVRGRGSFDAAVAGLQAVLDAGIRGQVEVVLSRANAHEALQFIALGEQLDASEVNFSALTPHGRALHRRADTLDHALWCRLVDMLRTASRLTRVPVTPNCALTGECVANIEPHVTCDGWLTPCYLSPQPLVSVLDAAPGILAGLLQRSRQQYEDVCGRRAWTRPPESVDGQYGSALVQILTV